MRFAGQLLARLGTAIKDIAPKSWGEAAFEFGPDVAFSVLAGLSAPSGWQGQVGAEDLAINLGGSLLGRLAGRSVGKRVIQNATDEQIRNATNMGSLLVAAPASMFAPRPVFQSMLESQQAQQQITPAQASTAEGNEQERILRDQLISSLLLSGNLSARAIGDMAPAPAPGSFSSLMGVI